MNLMPPSLEQVVLHPSLEKYTVEIKLQKTYISVGEREKPVIWSAD